jgi:hypothetical protein
LGAIIHYFGCGAGIFRRKRITLQAAQGGFTGKRRHRAASETDAKSQYLTYQYDNLNRPTSDTRANAPGGVPVLRTSYYDAKSLDTTGFSQYTSGRLAAVITGAGFPPPNGS